MVLGFTLELPSTKMVCCNEPSTLNYTFALPKTYFKGFVLGPGNVTWNFTMWPYQKTESLQMLLVMSH